MSSEHPSAVVVSTPEQVEQTSFLALQAWLAGSPWRLSGGWFFIAGLAAAGGLTRSLVSWVTLALGLVLAGMLWGGLWTQLTATRGLPDAFTTRRPALPYVTPLSPLGRMVGWQKPGVLGQLVRIGLPLLGLAALVAYLLGTTALLLTTAAVAIVLVGSAAIRADLQDLWAWMRALVVAGLPFALGILTVAAWPDQPRGLWLLGLAGGYVFLAVASVTGAGRDPGIASLLLGALGTAVICGVLVVANLPMAAVVTLLLTVPPLLAQSGRTSSRLGASQAWWLGAVACSSLALGFGIG
ncbi:MAG: hypothetical protein KDI07_03875 [Anaerolineae bacterium]|nr:hypothetical protein [Anaerolineae bacterium]MCB9131838.1 hypothetical protein [Anaerolineales bacterium]MCB0236328.1 hypothetical protein [Anaerolineae bacterium]MCB0238670.1 hypothetical protein [Anaerolineae bacterium]MCB0242813.1 hypothetical protein [Anaerolineae bacterium]